MASAHGRHCDPVRVLPDDLVALCLSFVGVETLLGAAQLVNRSWHHAIDGNLPAVWTDVQLQDPSVSNADLAEVVRKCRNQIRTLKITPQGLHAIRSLSNLRVLHICLLTKRSISPLLSSLPLLEELFVSYSIRHPGVNIVFPVMQHLRTFICRTCWLIKGIHNLHALSTLELAAVSVEASTPWPASLREFTIYDSSDFNPQLLDRIAALQHPTKLDTDWQFLYPSDPTSSFFTPPYEQFAFLSTFTSLHYLSTSSIDCPHIPFFTYISALTSLRELRLEGDLVSDQDLQCLRHLRSLHRLTFYCLLSVTSNGFKHVASLPNLIELTVVNCERIADYTPISSCTALRMLDIWEYRALSLAEVQAITQLSQLEELRVSTVLNDSNHVSMFCSIRSLRDLDLSHTGHHGAAMPRMHATVFSGLATVLSLERLLVSNIQIEEGSKLVDYLVQLPELYEIAVYCKSITEQDQFRIRDALPRLEVLQFDYRE